MRMIDCYDEAWREILEPYRGGLLALLFPEISEDVDWGRPLYSLNSKTTGILGPADRWSSIEQLFNAGTKSNPAVEVLVHLAVQFREEPRFAERMFLRNCQLLVQYGRPVVSIAVLADDDPDFRPDRFVASRKWGCKMKLRFPSVKLLDYEDRWDELESSTQPFALVVMAHLRTRATSGRPEERFQWRLRLTRWLYERGFRKREDAVGLHRFLERLMALPESLENRINEHVRELEQEADRPFVTSIEQEGFQKGFELGRRQGAILHVCEMRELALDEEQTAHISDCMDLEQLDTWLLRAAQVDSAADLFGD